MAYVDKSFGNLTGNGSDFTVGSLSGLPSIPANATLDSVWLYFNAYRKDGSINGGKVSVSINGTDHKVSDIERNKQYNGLSFNLTNYVSNSNGTLSYTHGSSISIKVYHNWWALGQADWTISGIYIRANYTIPTYTISTAVSPANSGSVSGGGVYENGSSAKLIATPNTGYEFLYWQDNPNNTNRERTVTVTGNASYTAVFKAITRTITVKAGEGCSYISLDGGDVINAGETKSYTLLYSSQFTLYSFPKEGYVFDHWNPSGDTRQNLPISLTEDMNVEAVFKLGSHTVKFNNFDGNTLKTETLLYGSKPTPPADPNRPETAQFKYIFEGWTDQNGNWWSSSYTITSDTVFTAQYDDETQKYTVTWKNYDGSVIDTYTDVPYGTKPSYNGTTPTRPSDNDNDYYYAFAGWSPSTDEPIQGDKEFVAQFAITYRYYTVKWVNPGAEDNPLEVDEVRFETQPDYDEATNGIPVHPSQNIDPEYEYTFIGWSAKVTDPAKLDTELEKVTGSIVYTAMYEMTKKTYAIRVILPNYDHTFLYEYGTQITLTAGHIDGYRFVKWSDGVTTEERHETVTGPATYEAICVKLYTITAKVNDGSMGSVTQSGNGTYEENETVTLTVNPRERRYYLSDWLKDGVSLGVNTNPLTFEATENAEYTAVFEELIIVNVQQTVTGGGTFEITGAVLTDYYDDASMARIYSRLGDIVTIKAVPDTGYHFVRWADSNTENETENPRQITFTSDMFPAVYAKFERIPPGIKVNDSRIDYVYIVPDANNPNTGTIVYVISGTVPTVEPTTDTVDGWHFTVSNTVPDNGYLLEKLFITDDKGDTIRIW